MGRPQTHVLAAATPGVPVAARLHPSVLFSICDSYIRRNEGSERVIGSLLGVALPDGTVDIRNAYAVPHNESSDQVALDIEYHRTMAELSARVNPKEVVVGWYSTGAGVSASDVLIHDFYTRETPSLHPIHLTVDTTFQALDPAASATSAAATSALRAYVSQSLSIGDKPLGAAFSEVTVAVGMADAEKIGFDSARRAPSDHLPSDLEGLEATVGRLQGLVETAHAYANDVVEGRVAPDNAVGRALWDAVAAVPRMSSETFDKLFNNGVQDVLLVLYLANLTRAQLSLAEKLNTAAQQM
eukprot:TRINITY_DN14085_c0_g2_i1.p1 TRINITY_DN14085_c0_g2~~TRINITY_DN14085_c0_g2_i1.p1  ORF type:complete len:330 (+),score=9.49 TRINITY_DN14085_c0_g2_i1:95-991(+)